MYGTVFEIHIRFYKIYIFLFSGIFNHTSLFISTILVIDLYNTTVMVWKCGQFVNW